MKYVNLVYHPPNPQGQPDTSRKMFLLVQVEMIVAAGDIDFESSIAGLRKQGTLIHIAHFGPIASPLTRAELLNEIALASAATIN